MVQGSTVIGNVVSRVIVEGNSLPMSIGSVRSSQKSIAAVVDEELDKGLLHAEFYTVMIDKLTHIRTVNWGYQVFHTQWLSIKGAVSAIVALLDPLYSVLS